VTAKRAKHDHGRNFFSAGCIAWGRSGVILVCGPAQGAVPPAGGDEAMTVTPFAVPGTGAAEIEFDLFFRHHSSRLMGQAYVLAGESAGAQDLVQESFLRAWQHWDELRNKDHPEAWLRRVMYNLAISQWRRSRRLVPLGHLEPAGSEQHPDALALAAALRTLPRRQAQAIVLHDAAGLSASEVAKELSVPEGTVRSWLSRGRAVLAARMVETEVREEGAE
jgi:RNA polymerase sigma-70 factor, ECF subfamily